jgi:hypothetical protein
MRAKRVPLPGIKLYGGIDLEQVKLDRISYFDKRHASIPQELPGCIELFSQGCILHPRVPCPVDSVRTALTVLSFGHRVRKRRREVRSANTVLAQPTDNATRNANVILGDLFA